MASLCGCTWYSCCCYRSWLFENDIVDKYIPADCFSNRDDVKDYIGVASDAKIVFTSLLTHKHNLREENRSVDDFISVDVPRAVSRGAFIHTCSWRSPGDMIL